MPKNTFNGGQKVRKPRKAKSKNGQQDQRLAKLEKLVMPAIEYKSKDQINPDWTVSTTGRANYPMFALEQGDNNNERIGDKVTLLSHNISCTLRKGDLSNIIRVLWVVTPSTTAIGVSDVLEYANYTAHSDLVFSSPYKRRASTSETTFRVLFDKVYHFSEEQNTITDRYQLIPAKNGKQVQFNTVGSSMPDNYQLVMMAISDSAAAAHPALNVCCRSRYYDL